MKLYLLWEIYYDNCNEWPVLLDIYQDEDDAFNEKLRLEALVPIVGREHQYYNMTTKELK